VSYIARLPPLYIWIEGHVLLIRQTSEQRTPYVQIKYTYLFVCKIDSVKKEAQREKERKVSQQNANTIDFRVRENMFSTREAAWVWQRPGPACPV
jgi:hypothetical protein